MREVVTPKGSRFLLCQLSQTNPAFPKYPPQPVVRCEGYRTNVRGYMDWRLTTRDGVPAVEWSWEGKDEMDPAKGRGWAKLKDDQLHGMIFLHLGDESCFVAKRAKGKRTKRK
jgi:hypothetical protein